jgi:GNAT superfamily N-acetyltransferase
MNSPFVIRAATEADVPALAIMIREFAQAEDRPNRVTATEDDLRTSLFAGNPAADVLIAVDGEGAALGYALSYSTFVPYYARTGLFLKNLFVREHAQRKGLGKALMCEVVNLALDRGCCRLEWDALLDDDEAQHFYQRLGIEPHEVRPFYRLENDDLTAFADRLS